MKLLLFILYTFQKNNSEHKCHLISYNHIYILKHYEKKMSVNSFYYILYTHPMPNFPHSFSRFHLYYKKKKNF